MKNLDKFRFMLVESFKEILKDDPTQIKTVIKEDFIRDFIVAFITKQKDREVEKEMQNLKKTNPEYYEAIKDWDRRNEALLKQMEKTFPRSSKPAGPLATKEWGRKSFWKMNIR
jgi:hypothetical protein